jgi:hypothetical protein
MVYPGTSLFHRRQRGIPMHSYENRSEIRALIFERVAARLATRSKLFQSWLQIKGLDIPR